MHDILNDMDLQEKRKKELAEKIHAGTATESEIETFDVLCDSELMQDLKASVEDAKCGKTVPWENLKEDIQ